MGIRNRVQAIPMTTYNSAGLAAGYAAINAGGLPEACFLLKIINDSDADITISYDGVIDHDFLIGDGFLQIGFQTNSLPKNYVALLAKGTVLYFKGTAGTGNIFIVGYYQGPLV